MQVTLQDTLSTTSFSADADIQALSPTRLSVRCARMLASLSLLSLAAIDPKLWHGGCWDCQQCHLAGTQVVAQSALKHVLAGL